MEERDRQLLTDILFLLTDQLKEQKRIRWLLDYQSDRDWVFDKEKPE